MSSEPVYSAEHRKQFLAAVQAELDHAYAKHGALPWSRHEFFGVLREEVDELWDDIKADAPTENIIKEMTQIAAMCLRYAETVDRYRGPHPLPLPTRAALSPPQPVAGWRERCVVEARIGVSESGKIKMWCVYSPDRKHTLTRIYGSVCVDLRWWPEATQNTVVFDTHKEAAAALAACVVPPPGVQA